MNFYPHHIGDYAKDTRHLSMVEDGAYRRLLDVYYSHELPLPPDEAAVCRLVCARDKQEKTAVSTVLREFFISTPDGWRHKRCDKEIAKAQDKRIKASASADMRWHCERIANASQKACEGNAPNPNNQSQSQEKTKPLAPRDDSRSASNGTCVAYIPVNTGADFGINAGHLAEFEKAYPAVDCKQTLQEIRAWCVANPAKRKTKSGVMRFVNSWLAREQNKAR